MSFSSIGLFAAKNPINVGAALRAANCYDSKLVVVHGSRTVRASTDTAGAYAKIPTLRVQTAEEMRAAIPFGAVPVAVELVKGAIFLPDYRHPPQAFYVFGPEDGTLGDKVLSWCRDKIMVPTKHCMNLAATVNVVLYDRVAKEMRGPHRDASLLQEDLGLTSDGTGQRLETVPCSVCNGTTWLDADLGRRCPLCSGTGRLRRAPIRVLSKAAVREAALKGRIGQTLESL